MSDPLEDCCRVRKSKTCMERFWSAHRSTGHQRTRNTFGSHKLCGSSSRSRLERSPHIVGTHSRGARRAVRMGFARPQRSQQGQLPSTSRQTGTQRLLLVGTMKDCGSACARFSSLPRRWVGWGFGALPAHDSPPIGPVGRTPSPLSGRGTEQ